MKSKVKLVSNFYLPSFGGMEISSLNLSSRSLVGLGNIWKSIKNDENSGMFFANPSTLDLIAIYLFKLLYKGRKIFVFDLILKYPVSNFDRAIARVKSRLIGAIDFIIAIHKDTHGYEKFYGIPRSKFSYIPFKANNYTFSEQYLVSDGEYAVAAGASQRDYNVLISAAKKLKFKVVVLCSDEDALKHNADIGIDSEYPINLVRVRERLAVGEWYSMIAGSSFVVVPILENSIQPAGISVYLEAMMLKKAVIVTEGASVNQILTHETDALVVKSGDSQSLASSMDRLYHDTDFREQLAQAGYQYATSLKGDDRLRLDLSEYVHKTLSKIDE